MSFFDNPKNAGISPGTPEYAALAEDERKAAIIQAMLSGQQQVPLQNYRPLNGIADILRASVGAYKSGQIAKDQADQSTSFQRHRSEGMSKLGQNWNNEEILKSLVPDPYIGAEAGKRLGDFKEHFVDVGVDPATGASRQRQTENNELKYGPSPSKGTNVTVNTGSKTNEELMKAGIKYLQDNQQLFNEGAAQFSQTEKAKKAITEGSLKGNLAGVTQGLAEFTHSLGGDLDPKTANFQIVKTAMVPLVLDKLKTLKPASDSDRQFLQQAVGQDPSMIADKDVVELFNVYQRSLQKQVQHYVKVKKLVGQMAAGKQLGEDAADIFASPDFGDFGSMTDPAALPPPVTPKKVYKYDANGQRLP